MRKKSNMKRFIWALVLFGAIASPAQANGPAPNTTVPREEGIPIEKIEKALKSYAEAIGCNFRFDKNNVVQLDPSGGRPLQYVALFFLDDGCAAGSSTGSSMFAVLIWGGRGSDTIFVSPAVSQPAAPSFGFPWLIERIFVKGNQLWYSGKVYDWSKDTLNSPSVPIEGQVLLRKGVGRADGNKGFEAWYWLSAPQY